MGGGGGCVIRGGKQNDPRSRDNSVSRCVCDSKAKCNSSNSKQQQSYNSRTKVYNAVVQYTYPLDHPLLKGFTRFRVNVRRLAVITGGGGTVRRRLRALTRRRKGRGDGYRLHGAQLGD